MTRISGNEEPKQNSNSGKLSDVEYEKKDGKFIR